MDIEGFIIVMINDFKSARSSLKMSCMPLITKDVRADKFKYIECVIDATLDIDWFAHCHC